MATPDSRLLEGEQMCYDPAVEFKRVGQTEGFTLGQVRRIITPTLMDVAVEPTPYSYGRVCQIAWDSLLEQWCEVQEVATVA